MMRINDDNGKYVSSNRFIKTVIFQTQKILTSFEICQTKFFINFLKNIFLNKFIQNNSEFFLKFCIFDNSIF